LREPNVNGAKTLEPLLELELSQIICPAVAVFLIPLLVLIVRLELNSARLMWLNLTENFSNFLINPECVIHLGPFRCQSQLPLPQGQMPSYSPSPSPLWPGRQCGVPGRRPTSS
jgi:hypothetical protein